MKKFQAEPKEPNLEDSFEQEEEKKEKIDIQVNTMADFLKSLKWTHDLAEDEETKRQTAHQITKIEMSLSSAGYSADKIKVKELGDGTLGAYYVVSGEVAISKDLLEDMDAGKRLITHVLRHEKFHKEFLDEGLTELATSKRLSDGLSFYVTKKQKAESAFYNTGVDKALSLYNIKKPDELLEYYLQVELEKNFQGQTAKLKKMKGNERNLEFQVKKQEDKIKEGFKKGASELFKKLRSRNYSIKKRTREILTDMINEVS